MNLRKIGEYSIGLDLGTGSVGWAVVDDNGDLAHFKGKPTWGSRLFPTAETAASARAPRGQRRRYVRRRWRLNLLQEFFLEEMEILDPTFFVRLNQSRLHKEDKDDSIQGFQHPLFNDPSFDERAYYEQYPTIYHLRKHLMESDEKADIRLVYLALHHIVKYRGNFLRQDEVNLSAANADVNEAVEAFCKQLNEWCGAKGLSCDIDSARISEILNDKALHRADAQEKLGALISLSNEDGARMKDAITVLSKAPFGYKVNFAKLFDAELENSDLKLSEEEKAEMLLASLEDEDASLFIAIQCVYSAYALRGLLTLPGLSASKVASYEKYREDLALLKALVKEYAPERYDAFFRGERYEGSTEYDVSKAVGYTRYNLGANKKGSGGKEFDLKKEIEKELGKTEASNDPSYSRMIEELSEEKFLRRQRTSDNGKIPFQLHLEEMAAILEKQGEHYSFLKQEREKIMSLVSFRIPYYVGPLTQKNARLSNGENGSSRFAWSERNEGMENVAIKPWNWEEVIDKNRSAEAFIRRMTGTCTYLEGEPVLPRCSLLYEEFCVLNELNGARWTQDGDTSKRLCYDYRRGMVEDLFCNGKVSYKKAESWLAKKGHTMVKVEGGQGETGFESRMGSYIFFKKDVFNVSELPLSYYPMCEQIILWSTLFEDRSILKEKIERAYGKANGGMLDDEQIKKICRKRFAGWGRLSEKLLTGIKAPTDCGMLSVMDILRDGCPNGNKPGAAMNFMEIIHDSNLEFEKRFERANKEARGEGAITQINDLPGSPAIRRTINQAIRIVNEIVSIAGHAPKSIYIETTHSEGEKKRTNSRYKQAKQALKAFKADKHLLDDLEKKKANLDDEKLLLYFLQNGRSMYSWEPLDIRNLSMYQVDHIIPQSYVKDDSLENKALVLLGENQQKADNMLIDASIRSKMAGHWRALHDAGMIGDKKYRNLLRADISDNQLKGFIARQIVETSQSVKLTRQLLEERYPDTNVQPIRAALSSQLRDRCGFVKCREVNDYHHAHDAYLACQMGSFIESQHPMMFRNPVGMARVIRSYVQEQSSEAKKGNLRGGVFLVGSFMRNGVNKETGEIWDAEAVVAKMTKCFGYKDCFISRMPEETSGAFWDATVYSPHAKVGGRIPLKKGLDPQKYGSYNTGQFAYYFAFEAKTEKGKSKVFFEGVPLTMVSTVREDPAALEALAASIAGEKYASVRILQPRLLKYQKVALGNDEFYLAGQNEVRSARQVTLERSCIVALQEMIDGADLDAMELVSLYEALIPKILFACSRFTVVHQAFEEGQVQFERAGLESKLALIRSLLAYLSGKNRLIDLSLLGGPKHAGSLKNGFVCENASEVFIMNQSITGMFEKRTRLCLPSEQF